MLQPLLKKPDGLYFGVKGRPMLFAACVLFLFSDMLEVNKMTATYKVA